MEIKNENGIKRILCDNLGEVAEEFKKFRTAEIEANRKKDWNHYHFFRGLGFRIDKETKRVFEEIDVVPIYHENGVHLDLNIAPLNFKEKEWTPYDGKVKNILKEIWETGEVKDYQGLDLNWPAASQPLQVWCDQCHKYIGEDRKLAYFSDVEKNLDFCSESCHSKFKTEEKENQKLKEQLKKETKHKTIWMVISIATVSIFSLYLLFSWLKNKKLKKR